jgi:hypothetical protein
MTRKQRDKLKAQYELLKKSFAELENDPEYIALCNETKIEDLKRRIEALEGNDSAAYVNSAIIAAHTRGVDGLRKRVKKLERKVDELWKWTPTNVKITYHGNPVTDGVDFTQDALQPRQPEPSQPEVADMNITNGILYNDEGHAVSAEPSQPELVNGFWYWNLETGKLEQCDGTALQFDGGYRPATLDDLAHEVGGDKVWMVEYDGCIMLMVHIAREYAALAHIPIITEAQWKELTKGEKP